MSVYELLVCCKRAEVSVKWPTPSMLRRQRLADHGIGTNKPKMSTINPVHVVPGQRQEYRIDSSLTRLYEIDHKRQIKLLQTFIKQLVSELLVRGLQIVFIQPIYMLDGPRLCLPWQIVTLPTDVNARRVDWRFVFQDYNTRAQRARIGNAHLQQHNIYRMLWPTMSPDLSSIEHVWDMIERRVQQRQRPPTTLAELG